MDRGYGKQGFCIQGKMRTNMIKQGREFDGIRKWIRVIKDSYMS